MAAPSCGKDPNYSINWAFEKITLLYDRHYPNIQNDALSKTRLALVHNFVSVVECFCPDVNKRWSVEVLPIGWAAVAAADDGDSWWNWVELSPLSLLSATLSQCNSYCADLVKVLKWFLLGSSAAWFWPVLVKAKLIVICTSRSQGKQRKYSLNMLS